MSPRVGSSAAQRGAVLPDGFLIAKMRLVGPAEHVVAVVRNDRQRQPRQEAANRRQRVLGGPRLKANPGAALFGSGVLEAAADHVGRLHLPRFFSCNQVRALPAFLCS